MRILGLLLLCSLLLLVLCSSCGSQEKVSRIRVAESSIELGSSVAVIGDIVGRPIVEVTFFADDLSEDEMATVASKYWVAWSDNVNGKFAVFKITFWLEQGSTECDFESLASYNVVFYDSETCPVPVTNHIAQWSFGRSQAPWEKGEFGVSKVQGGLEVGNRIKARVKYEATSTRDTAALAPGVDSLPLKWDIWVDCPLRTEG